MKTKKYFVYLIVLLCIFSCDRFAQSSAPAQYDIFIEGEKDAKVTIQYSNWDSDNHVNRMKTEEVTIPYLGEGIASVVDIADVRNASLFVTNTTNSNIKVIFASLQNHSFIHRQDTFFIHNILLWNYDNKSVRQYILPEKDKILMDSLYVLLKMYDYPTFKELQQGESCTLRLQDM